MWCSCDPLLWINRYYWNVFTKIDGIESCALHKESNFVCTVVFSPMQKHSAYKLRCMKSKWMICAAKLRLSVRIWAGWVQLLNQLFNQRNKRKNFVKTTEYEPKWKQMKRKKNQSYTIWNSVNMVISLDGWQRFNFHGISTYSMLAQYMFVHVDCVFFSFSVAFMFHFARARENVRFSVLFATIFSSKIIFPCENNWRVYIINVKRHRYTQSLSLVRVWTFESMLESALLN